VIGISTSMIVGILVGGCYDWCSTTTGETWGLGVDF
jgi:hypothetical protein